MVNKGLQESPLVRWVWQIALFEQERCWFVEGDRRRWKARKSGFAAGVGRRATRASSVVEFGRTNSGNVMSFYESLDVFVGAGLIAVLEAAGAPVPAGAVAAGTGLSRFLRDRGDANRFGEILDRLAQDVWLSRDTHGIPVELAEKHATGLVTILEHVRPAAARLAAAIDAPVDLKLTHASATAVEIVSRAHQQNLLTSTGLTDHIAMFMLERLFVQLTVDSDLLRSLEPMISAYIAGTIASQPKVHSTPATAPDQLAPVVSGGGIVIKPQGNTQQSALALIQERYGIGNAAMHRFMAIIEAQKLKPESRLARLEELAIWLQVTTKQLTKPTNDDPGIRRIKAEAAEALATGEFERAMDRLKEVRSELRGQRRRTQERLEDEIHQLKLHQIEEAAACARLAELAFARGEYDAASDLFAEAADGVPTSEPLLRLNYALRQADTLHRKGDLLGDDVALSAAAEHYRRALGSAEKHQNTELVVAARCALGETLSRMSRDTESIDQLSEAVSAWRAALSMMDRNREPRRIAAILTSLGDAIYRLSERFENRDENNEFRIDEAAHAYGEAAALLDSRSAPLDWALAQLGRGSCLLRIAERDGKDRFWLEAATALVPALEVLEAEGLGEVGRQARESLRSFHANWSRLLEKPASAANDQSLPQARAVPRTGTQ